MIDLLALDFDGVICNGLLEYFETARRAYCQIWSTQGELEQWRSFFYQLRPVVETGWEMPVVIHALASGVTAEEILTDWPDRRDRLVKASGVTPPEIGQCVDQLRDQWISQDLAGWLSLHSFYPGVVERLNQVLAQGIPTYIISTKEKRFILQLLQQAGVNFPAEQVFGKECDRPKSAILLDLLPAGKIWFIEDRWLTLTKIAALPQLESVELFLADWGYNTEPMRQAAQAHPRIHLLSLGQFSQDFTAWDSHLDP